MPHPNPENVLNGFDVNNISEKTVVQLIEDNRANAGKLLEVMEYVNNWFLQGKLGSDKEVLDRLNLTIKGYLSDLSNVRKQTS